MKTEIMDCPLVEGAFAAAVRGNRLSGEGNHNPRVSTAVNFVE